jgi:hypothetical protein
LFSVSNSANATGSLQRVQQGPRGAKRQDRRNEGEQLFKPFNRFFTAYIKSLTLLLQDDLVIAMQLGIFFSKSEHLYK